MAKNKEYELAIKIAGEIEKSFTNSTKLTKSELQNIAKQASMTSNSISNSFDKGFSATDKGFSKLSSAATKSFNAVKSAATVAATTIAAITAASATAGIAYESAFAGVKKTTEATTEEYEKLRQSILDMSTKEIPATANEIAEVAEVAGQLGVEKDNLLDFSRVMIDLGESTNLSATEAASSLAKFANITGMGVDKYSNLGSVIVAMGNNFATTEADIVSMGTRLAASGDLAGLSETQIMALATAMSSVGIESEAGGSAMSKLLKKMQVSVETEDKLLKQFAKTANMTSGEFKKAFQEDAVGALSAFIDGLNDTKRNGKSATVVLDDMGLTEVRLSNTILSLANSNGLMTEAVKMANSAWDENTALSEEAAKRYETMESKLKIFRNGITGIGIQLYDEFSGPMGEAVEAGTSFVNNLSEDIIPTLIKGFKEKLPTVIRRVKEFASAFIDFAEPVISLGKWLVKNPEVIVSMLAGIGATLAAYKIESGIRSVAKGFAALGAILTNPFALAITAVALAIGGAVGIAAYIASANKELKKQNLAEHFGSISLSLEDLQDIATRIIQTDKLGKMSEAMAALGALEGIENSIEDSVKAINKMNWKVGIGLTLTEDEQSQYKSSIESFIKSSQDLITQNQYAISLALELFTNDDETGNGIKAQVNSFYTKTYTEVSELGTKLQAAVNEAFEDGLLDVDEAAVISDYMNQMASITQKIADADFAASLDILKIKYSGTELTPDAYANLQTELNNQVESAVADYDESLQYTLSNFRLMLGEGEINQVTFDQWVNEATKNYLDQVTELKLKSSDFQLNTIFEAYEDELETAMPGYKAKLDQYMKNYFGEDYAFDWAENPGVMLHNLFAKDNNLFKSEELDKTTRSALNDLFTKLQPSVESLEDLQKKYKDLGVNVPSSLSEGLTDAAVLGALVRDTDSVAKLISDTIANDEEYAKVIADCKEMGASIPATITKAIQDATPVKTTIPFNLRYKMLGDQLGLPTSFDLNDWRVPVSMPGYAKGGIITSPTIATFAEEVPEAAIPLDGSSNSIGLWKTVGRILGVYTQNSDGSDSFVGNQSDDSFGNLLSKVPENKSGGSKSGPPNITYSPNYNFYGSAPTKEDMVEAARMSQEEFNEMMDEWSHGKDRLSFA